MARMEEVRVRRPSDGSETPANTLANLEPLFQVGSRFIDTWLAVSTELFEFGKTRLDHSLEAGRAIAQSTSLNEAIDAQAQFTRTTVEDYMSEANKLADLSARSWLDGLSTLQKPMHAAIQPHAEAAE